MTNTNANRPRPRASFEESFAMGFNDADRHVTEAALDLAKFIASGYALDSAYVSIRIDIYNEAVARRDFVVAKTLELRMDALRAEAAAEAAASHARLRREWCVVPGCAVHPENAVALVAADVRASYPEMSDAEAVAHVRNTLRLPEDAAVAGAVEISEDGSLTARAYRAILEG